MKWIASLIWGLLCVEADKDRRCYELCQLQAEHLRIQMPEANTHTRSLSDANSKYQICLVICHGSVVQCIALVTYEVDRLKEKLT